MFKARLLLVERKLVVTELLKRHGLEAQFKFIVRPQRDSGVPVLDLSDYVLLKTNSTEVVKALKDASSSYGEACSIASVVAQRVFSPTLHQDAVPNNEKKVFRGGKRGKTNPQKRLNPAYSMGAYNMWNSGVRGQRVRVAVFDTGVSRSSLEYFSSLADNFDWTDEGINNDVVGHGTFVAGIIGSNNEYCPGIAPDAELYSFRIFNKKRSS